MPPGTIPASNDSSPSSSAVTIPGTNVRPSPSNSPLPGKSPSHQASSSLSPATTYTLSSGFNIPLLGCGVYLVPPDYTVGLVHRALVIGYRLFDTAQIYRNEHQVAQGILRWIADDPAHNHRASVFIVTKIWDSFHGYDAAKRSIKLSIRNICVPGIDYIDLFLIHSPNSDKHRRLQTYSALQDAQDSPYVRSIGVSNFGSHHISELLAWPSLRHKPTVNQLEIHPWLMRADLVALCHSHNILCQAYSPLAKGRKFNDPVLNNVAKKYKRNNAQILIRWSLQRRHVVLPKTAQLDRLQDNFNVWDFELDKEDLQALDHENDYYITGWDPTLYSG